MNKQLALEDLQKLKEIKEEIQIEAYNRGVRDAARAAHSFGEIGGKPLVEAILTLLKQ